MSFQRKFIIWRNYSVLSAALIGAFWAIWYAMNGSVPVVTDVVLTLNYTLSLPFGMSRWFDMLLGPLAAGLLVPMFTSERVMKDKYFREDLAFGLVYGLIYGLVVGPVYGLAFELVYGLAVGLGFGLVFGLVYGLDAGLVYGLAAGLVVGLVSGLVFGLVFGLVYGLLTLLKFLFTEAT